MPIESGRYDAGLVEDEKVVWAQVVRKVLETTMFDQARSAMEDEESRTVTRLDRLLGDEALREIVVEVSDTYLVVEGCGFAHMRGLTFLSRGSGSYFRITPPEL